MLYKMLYVKSRKIAQSIFYQPNENLNFTNVYDEFISITLQRSWFTGIELSLGSKTPSLDSIPSVFSKIIY